jgi:hypothetical protein
MLKKLGGISPVRLFCDKANMRSAGRRDKPSGMELSIRFWSNSSYTIFVRFASDGGMWLESELWLNRSTVRFGNASSHRGTPPTIEVVVVEVRDVEGGAIAERVRYLAGELIPILAHPGHKPGQCSTRVHECVRQPTGQGP